MVSLLCVKMSVYIDDKTHPTVFECTNVCIISVYNGCKSRNYNFIYYEICFLKLTRHFVCKICVSCIH